MLLAIDRGSAPISLGQDADPEILGVVTIGVHHLDQS